MAKIKVRLQAHRHIYIHNNLANAAFHFKARVEKSLAQGKREGVGLEIMAGLTMLAFASEARVNFLGDRLFPDWKKKERDPALEKVEEVCRHLGVTPDFDLRPYASIKALRDFRNTLAHGKPAHIYVDQEIVATPDELDQRDLLHADWEGYLDKDFLATAYDDVNTIWKDLLTRSGLEVFDTLTHGGSSMEFIEHVNEA